MGIRLLMPADVPQVVSLWNESLLAGETVLAPLTEQDFHEVFPDNPDYNGKYSFVREEDGAVVGFINGVAKKNFLPGETPENTPGYLTCIFVRHDCRRRGIGASLESALADAFRSEGKKTIACNGDGDPIHLRWIIPGTPGHDHNKAPGMDTDCPGYPFLLSQGYTEKAREIAMYLNLSEYEPWTELECKRQQLLEQGIYTGRYDSSIPCEYDRMCDRVGKEYWRFVIRSEVACHKTGMPNTDPLMLPDPGKIPAGPRPLLVATHEGHIVAFTGPVDLQKSGRGWFCGICTDPMYERRGIASVLFNLLIQEFIAEGASFSTLFTGETNHAQRIYQRAGFRTVRRFGIMEKTL